MPILGLTDRGATFPRIGILRKGAPKRTIEKNGKQIEVVGADLKDYFRFDTTDEDAATAFTAAYGDKPNGIRVTFFYRTAAENFEAWQEHHSAGALKHRCDGQTCVLHLLADGTYSHEPIPCPSIALKAENPKIDKKHLCRPVGRLKVIVPELNRMAYVLVATTSINDILELQGNLEAAEAMRGDLRGIRFILTRRMRKVSTPGDNGTRRRMDKWLLSLEPAPEWVQLQLTAMQKAALALPAPSGNGASYVDPDTGEIFDGDEEPSEAEQEADTEVAAGKGQRTYPAPTVAYDGMEERDLPLITDTERATPELATISGAANRFHSWYTDNGVARARFDLGETCVIAQDELAETWFDLEDSEPVIVTGAWAVHPKVGRYLAAATIARSAPVAEIS